jgi:3-oxoacyl-[acyl-carrier protein] reductase
VLVGRDSKKLESVAATLTGSHLIISADTTVEDDVKSIFAKTLEKFGSVDVVINAAGVTNLGAIGEIEPSSWWKDYVSNTSQFTGHQTNSERKSMLKERTTSLITSSRLLEERGHSSIPSLLGLHYLPQVVYLHTALPSSRPSSWASTLT